MRLSHLQLLALCQLASASPCKPSSSSGSSVIPTSTDVESSRTLSLGTASTTLDSTVTLSETESAFSMAPTTIAIPIGTN
ncbi:hypothetical protein ACHAO9_005804 [Fusarium lateritium]